jgi:hypothetical protein
MAWREITKEVYIDNTNHIRAFYNDTPLIVFGEVSDGSDIIRDYGFKGAREPLFRYERFDGESHFYANDA